MIKHSTPWRFLIYLVVIFSLSSLSSLSAQYSPTDDFDGDGIINSIDLDDDNDGVPDAVESPTCFYTASEWNTLAKPTTNAVVISSALTTTTGNFSQLLDNVPGTTAVTFTAGQPIQNANVYLFTFAKAVRLDALYLKFNTTTQFANTTKIQGSNTNNGSDWVDLSAAIAQTAGTNTTVNGGVSVTTSIKYPVTLNTTTAYRYIRITGVAASNIAAQNASEVYFDFNTAAYVASFYPKATCTDANIDGDGVLPHFDLDSDGDGCNDSVEAGATTDITANYQFPYVDSNGDGLVDAVDPDGDGIVNYTSTYNNYAKNAAISACIDSDGDGVRDVIDVDDDNDGVLDAVECPAAFTNLVSGGGFTTDPPSSNWYRVIVPDYDTPVGNLDNNGHGNSTLTGGLFSEIGDQNGNTGVLSILVNDPPRPAVSKLNERLIAGVPYKFSIDLGGRSANGSTTESFVIQLYNADSDVMANTLATDFMNTLPGPNATNTPSSNYKTISGSFTVSTTGNYYLVIAATGPGGISDDFVFDRVAIKGDAVPQICDVDNDGIPNYLDLDSDGDGCPDAVEAGVSTNPGAAAAMSPSGGAIYSGGIPAGTANAYVGNGTPAQYGPNGFFNDIETGGNGVYNGTYTYSQYALANNLSVCADTDGDGISDIVDIDDDNDGVLDAVESPACFYTAAEVTVPQSVTTQIANTGVIANTYDNNTSTTFAFTAAASKVNLTIFEITPFSAVKAANVFVRYSGASANALGTTANSVSVDGWNGTSWVTLQTYTPAAASANVQTFAIPAALQATYSKYRLQGLLTTVSGVAITEVGLTPASDYNPSAHPKPTCSNDTDGDTVMNHHDLDSDGDGCPDAMESGVYEYVHSNGGVMSKGNLTTNSIDPAGVANATAGSGASADYGANGYYNLLETSGNGIANYISTYDMALDAGVSNCADADGDEVPDFIDIDDDNDGILDRVEACPMRQYSVPGDTIDGTTTTVESSVASTGFAESTSTGCTANSVSDNQYPYVNPAACSFITRTGTQTSGTWKITFSSPVAANKIMLGFTTSAVAGTNITYTYDVNPGTDATIGTARRVEFSNIINTVNVTKNGIATFNQTVAGANDSGVSLRGLGNRTVKSLQFSISGLATTGAISFFVYVQSDNCDPDGDGIPNSLDNDSDNDGCPDAKEAGVIDYITANGGTYSSGVLNNPSSSLSSEAIVGNNTPSDYGNNGFYSGIENNDTASAAYQGTYTYSNVINALVSNCIAPCYRPAVTAGTVLDTNHGITSLQRAGADNGNWPMVRKGAWTALESKTKGFVPNRLTATQIGDIPAANLVEGMMVYNITEDCLYINTDGTPTGWKCFNTQTCP